MFLPLTVTLVSAPGLAVFLVARSSFFTWATASIKPLNKRALNRVRFISDVVPSREYTTRAAAAPAGFTSGSGATYARDPLSPPFHVNLVRGLRFVQASLLVRATQFLCEPRLTIRSRFTETPDQRRVF